MTHHVDISHLTPAERLLLVEDLWDSLAAKPSNIPVPQEHMDELARRLEAEARGELTARSWEETKRQLFHKK